MRIPKLSRLALWATVLGFPLLTISTAVPLVQIFIDPKSGFARRIEMVGTNLILVALGIVIFLGFIWLVSIERSVSDMRLAVSGQREPTAQMQLDMFIGMSSWLKREVDDGLARQMADRDEEERNPRAVRIRTGFPESQRRSLEASVENWKKEVSGFLQNKVHGHAHTFNREIQQEGPSGSLESMRKTLTELEDRLVEIKKSL